MQMALRILQFYLLFITDREKMRSHCLADTHMTEKEAQKD